MLVLVVARLQRQEVVEVAAASAPAVVAAARFAADAGAVGVAPLRVGPSTRQFARLASASQPWPPAMDEVSNYGCVSI